MPRAYVVVYDGIGPVLGWAVATVVARTATAMESGKERVEGYAKMNAPWADRTGAAREGLTASVSEHDAEITLELAHTVEYGIWLETIQDGAFAIIMPTLEALGPEILREAGAQVVSVGRTF